jgi:hypothetical protein
MKEELTAERRAGWCSRVETSSYTRALQGEPVRRFTHFARQQIVACQLPFEGDFSV